ncbi:HEAT repeat domain-containing protein [Lysobacter sp. cf310]|uniref:HEAT repeat domain-containing protein n=1 Tax=Lysobacter sp. cf310 TaxID=1761790 RepID=UPI0008DECCE8|nr:HEAT repeat domain-containing protein [Lysobacter sp. cf310]SFL19966.1 HEAT repeat-containing protein [Lysobacter sp. cf310]
MIGLWLDRWFGKRTSAPLPAPEALFTPTQERMAQALAHSGGRRVPPHRAAERLQNLPSHRYLILDQSVRTHLSEYERLSAQATPEFREFAAQLFIQGCDRDGRLRQRALQTMRKHPGRLATALALIRCDDWVPQVRDEAMALLTDIVDREGSEPLFELGGLLLSLRGRQRIQARAWPELIEPALRRTASATRWRVISSGDARARALAYAYTLDAEPDRAHELGLYAITDIDPANARWALDAVAPRLPALLHHGLARAGLLHPQARIRAQAVRMLHAEQADTRALLEQRILDSAAAPRGAATYLLRNRHGVDPLPLWRAALENGSAAQARAALQALADHGQPEDAARLLPWLQHRAGAVRAVALRALVRTGTPEALDRLPAALRDHSAKVRRQALALYQRLPGALNAETLNTALHTASDEATRATLAQATRLLDRWQALSALLQSWKRSPESLALRHEVANWVAARSGNATHLPATLRSELETLLDEIYGLEIGQRATIVHAMKYA